MKKSNLEFTDSEYETGQASLIFDREGNRKYLTPHERDAFLVAAQSLPEEASTFCLLIACTGARPSEMLALAPNRVDFDAGVLIFESLKKRRRGVYRAVPVPTDMLERLDRTLSVRARQVNALEAREPIWKCGRTTAWKWVRQAMKDANLDGLKATARGLRHAFAVASLQSGVPITFVKKWLGHSRLATTEIYSDAVGDEERSIAERLWHTMHFASQKNGSRAGRKLRKAFDHQ